MSSGRAHRATCRPGTLALPEHGLRALGPGVLAAVSWGFSDIFTKLALLAGADALTLATSRGVLGTLFVLAWLRAAPPRRLHARRERLIALGIGLLLAGNLYLLFAAIRMVAVPIAILSYFVYPLLTGIVGAAIGLERLPLASAAAAVVALLGLALMLGADTAHLAWLGVGLAIAAAGFMTSLWPAAVLFAFAGAADSVSAVCRTTITQTLTPDAMRGRVSAVFSLVVASGPRLGDVESGTVAAVTSPKFSVVSGGLACLVSVGAIALLMPGLAAYDTERAERDMLAAHQAHIEADPSGATVS